jgi:nucleotide-binding universal stress UspA family protein
MAVANVPIRVAFQNVLVATDFSEHNHSALRYAAAIARRAQGKVYVAHVISPSFRIGPEDVHPALCQTRREAERKLAAVMKSAELRGVHTEPVLKEGEFPKTLCKLAHERGTDLLVLSTRGRKGISKLILGSTVEGICKVAPCPMILTGPKVGRDRQLSFDRILYPTDLSPCSLGVLPYVLALAEQDGSLVRFVRILPPENESSIDSAKAELLTQFTSVMTARTKLAKNPEFAVECGEPQKTILDVAESWGADLIAMGAHRPGNLAAHFPGDLVYEVVCDAKCPVMTVRD